MSIKIMTMVFEARLGGATIKAVAVKLADYANDAGGNIWPALDTVADQTEVSKSSVQRAVRTLIEDEYLEVEREGGKGPGSTTRYRFNLTNLAAAPKVSEGGQNDQDSHGDHLNEAAKVVTDDEKGGQGDHRPIKRTIKKVSSSSASRELPTTEYPDFVSRGRPTVLDEDWELPADWRSATEAKHPHHADMIDVQASRFRKFNIDKLTASNDWPALWARWFDLAVNKAPGTQKARAIRDWDAGPTFHDTTFSGKNFQKYVDDCIKRGVYKPKPGAAP